jgi:dienelactone hydrolase
MPRSAATPMPQSLLIDAAGHTCVAWWHAPAPGADASVAPALPRGWLPGGALPLAVVLASSWGEEDVAGYDGQRALAVALAESGLGTLRFEWPDTGDSSAPTGTTTIAEALAAFDAAASRALALSGCGRLAFVGLRLGALLAAHAAVARDDVDALVALLPVASGRAFVREQRTPGAGPAAPLLVPGAAFDAAELRVPLGGFTQSVRHLEALSALKWPADATSSVREALLLWPVSSPGRAPSDALARLGLRVREWAHDSLSGALAATHQARLAPVAIAEIVRWLQERAGDVVATPGAADAPLEAATGAVLALSAAGERAWMPLREGGVAVRERLVRIGDPRDREPPLLAAVLGERDAPVAAGAARPARRGIVLLSSGRERRIGPHRLWVPWARRRAAQGDVVLRLDLPGIGDSVRHAQADAGRPDHYDTRGTGDIARAVAWLRREHGVGECAVMGVCSGAWQAWRAALAGVDVQQLVAINPRIFHWVPGVSLDPTADALGQGGAAAHVAFGAVPGALAARARDALRLRAREIARVLRWPLENDLAAELAQVVARGVALDFVFSSRDPGLALMREEGGRRGARLARDGRMKVSVVEHADSTFAGMAGRIALYASLDSLLLPAPATTASPTAPCQRPAAVRP